MAYIEEMQGVHYDELIGGTAITPLIKNGVLTGVAADTEVPKGTLLAVDAASGKYIVAAKADASVPLANAILAKGVMQGEDTGDIAVTVYIRGLFNREKLVAASGDTVDAHEEELRDVGIYLTGVK